LRQDSVKVRPFLAGIRIPEHCSSDILVPDKAVVYMSPALILHYIRVHQYLPPACFVAAVLNCPEPGSEEYRAAIRKMAPDLAAGLDYLS